MKKYLNEEERYNIAILLNSKNIEDIKLGIGLLRSLQRYKYFKNKIIYRYKDNKYTKMTVLQLIKICEKCFNVGYIPYAANLIAKSLLKYDKVF